MKKILFLLVVISLAAAPMAFADVSASDQTGNFTIGTGDTLNFNTSPSVLISIETTATDYAITSANDKTDTTNGMEYGTLSTATGYAQRTKITEDSSGDVTDPADSTSLDGDWTWMGGSGS